MLLPALLSCLGSGLDWGWGAEQQLPSPVLVWQKKREERENKSQKQTEKKRAGRRKRGGRAQLPMPASSPPSSSAA